jgi:hypothetical protein
MKQAACNLTDRVDGFLLGKRYVIMDRDPLFTSGGALLLEASRRRRRRAQLVVRLHQPARSGRRSPPRLQLLAAETPALALEARPAERSRPMRRFPIPATPLAAAPDASCSTRPTVSWTVMSAAHQLHAAPVIAGGRFSVTSGAAVSSLS